MSNSNGEWNYPNLEQCRVVVKTPSSSSTADNQPPVRLPHASILNAIDNNNSNSIPTVYDFALEQNVLEKYKQRLPLIEATAAAATAVTATSTAASTTTTSASPDHQHAPPTALSDRDTLKKNLIVEMKSVTGADESICVALLESHSFDLKTSIETFFAEGSLREIPE